VKALSVYASEFVSEQTQIAGVELAVDEECFAPPGPANAER